MTDLVYAFRSLRRRPSFVVTAVLTLAIGIAANTAVGTLMTGLVFRSIPAREPARLARIYPLDLEGRRQTVFPQAEYRAIRESAGGFEAVAAYVPELATLRFSDSESEPREALAYVVSGEYFHLLGAAALVGRMLVPGDDRAGAPPVAVISYRLWQALGGAPDVVGRPLHVNVGVYTIVGVAPGAFVGTEPLVADVWVPLATAPVSRPAGESARGGTDRPVLLVGRLDPAASRRSAADQLSPVVRTSGRTTGSRHSGVTVRRATFFPVDRDPLSVGLGLLAATGLLLAAAWANVTNLFLAEGLSRRREIAVRLALGGGRAAIVRQFLAESLWITAAAAVTGLLMTSWTLSLLIDAGVSWLPTEWGSFLLDLRPDAWAFAFTVLVVTATTLVLAAAPAMQAARLTLPETLHSATPSVRGHGVGLARRVMITAQVAIALALEIVAGLLARAAARAEALELGFDPRGVLTTEFDLARLGYRPERAAAFNQSLAAAASRLPGVTSVALASHVPLTGGMQTASVWAPEVGRSMAHDYTRAVYVGAGYFRTLGVPLVRGRDVRSAGEAVIGEVIARRLWPDGNPLGARVRTSLSEREYVVVGLARDTHAGSLFREKEAAIYLAASTDADLASTRPVVAASGSLADIAARLRAAAREMEPAATVRVTPLERVVALWELPARAAAAAGGALALVALLIASLGLFGVLSRLLAQQSRELGIRCALGADARRLAAFGSRQAVRLVLPGIAAGLVLGYAFARTLASFLFGLSPADPFTYVAATAIAGAAAAAACLGPARRASRVDPMVVLRTD